MAVLVAALVLVGLSSPASPATTTTSTAAPTTTAAPSGTPVTALLQAVGVFSQAGYDQVVFQFSNALPQYTVQVVSPPLSADPSGKPITIAGSVVVQVTMTPASGFDQTPPGTQVYTGPTDITFNGASVMQVVERGDFEGVLSWYIGLRQPVPRLTTTASDPSRIAIDFAHPPVTPSSGPTFTG